MVNEFFDHVFCISLQRRRSDWLNPKTGSIIKGRYNDCVSEFERHRINVEFIDGVDGLTLQIPAIKSSDGEMISPGDIGCVLSHLKVVKIARDRGYKNYLVFEDDIQLATDFAMQFNNCNHQVPSDWDMVYLGGSHIGPITHIAENVARITQTFTTHAIGVKSTIYQSLIDIWSLENEKVDISVSSLHSRFNCYVIRPHIAFQRQSYSDILEKDTYYEHLKK